MCEDILKQKEHTKDRNNMQKVIIKQRKVNGEREKERTGRY
jgi:hypothetical protein